MKQEFKGGFAFRKRMSISMEALTFLVKRLAILSPVRQRVYFDLPGSALQFDADADFDSIQPEVFGKANQISVYSDGEDYELSFTFFRSQASTSGTPSPFQSYARLNTQDESKPFLLNAVCEELQSRYEAAHTNNCEFISAVEEDRSARPITNEEEPERLTTPERVFTRRIRVKEPISWNADTLRALKLLLETHDLLFRTEVRLMSGEERKFNEITEDALSDSEASTLQKIFISGSHKGSLVDSISFFSERSLTGGFTIRASNATRLETLSEAIHAFIRSHDVVLRTAQESRDGRHRTNPSLSLGKMIGIGTLLLGAAGLYLSRQQLGNSRIQNDISSHADRATLIFSESASPGIEAKTTLRIFSIRNIGKSAAFNIVLRCADSDDHGALVPFDALAAGQEATKSFPIDLDLTNRVRDPERRCLIGPVYARYSDDGGEHYIRFDRQGNPEAARW